MFSAFYQLISKNLKDGKNQNLSSITQLIGQICFNKQETIYWSKIGQRVLDNSIDDLIWRKIGRRLIKQQNTIYLESIIRPLLMNATNYEQIEWYLDSELVNEKSNQQIDKDGSHKSTIKHLLTNKFLLINYYPSTKHQALIENIVGYLINYNLQLFKKTLYNVLSIWSNATLIRHQNKDQHYYLCRILICSLKYMIKLNVKLDLNEFLILVLHGAETHLKMVELDKRNCGLFVVEKLTNYLNKDNDKLEDKLDFEIELNDETKYLNDILNEKFNKDHKKATDKNHEVKNEKKVNDKVYDDKEYEYDKMSLSNNEDDLIPYDMSNDLPFIKTKKPIYLKDCLEGLMNNEEIDYNSTCLQCLPELIDKNRSQAKELNVDFIRVLLFLDNEDEDLKDIRFKTMIKLCNLDPIKSAQYLTNQFFDRNLSIVRKLEVLDVIVESAKELSSLENPNLIEDHKIKSIQKIVKHPKPEYERIVEERIKSKTRYLFPTSTNHQPLVPLKNDFVQYVNHYFYPLINNYDKKDITLKFNEDDYFVLGKLILALAELLKSVSQTHLTRKMAIALIDFLNVFKNHQESFVRKSIVLGIHSILTNVPNYLLFEELQTDLLSFRDFLINLKQSDPETFHNQGVLVLYKLEEQLNDYRNRIKSDQKMKNIRI